MKTTLRKALFVTFLLMLFLTSNAAAQKDLAAAKQHIKELIAKDYLLGASAAYIQSDGDIQYFSLGSIKTKRKKEPTKNTIYEIGSISKTFTSLVLARMVQRGLVSLQMPIGEALPDSLSPPTYNSETITLLNLATHTSGLPSLPTNFNPPDWLNPYADYTVQEMYEFLDSYELKRSSDSLVVYSNLGAGLLGHLLALKADMSYKKLIKKYITEPLKMEDTGITVPENKRDHFAAPYNFGQPVKRWTFRSLAGAGGIRSSVNDLVTYLKAQMGFIDTKLDSAITMTHRIRFDAGEGHTAVVGLAWFYSTKNDTIIWHNGGTGGYKSFIGWNIENGTGVVILSSGRKGVTDVGLYMLDKKNKLHKIKETVQVDSTILSSYTGFYRITPAFGIKIFMKEGHLMAEATGQKAFHIYSESQTRFFLKKVEAEIEFIKNEKGKVSKLKLYQNGRILTGMKGNRVIDES